MRRVLLCAVVLSACLTIVVPTEAGITKSLFSEQSGSIGLQVTLFQSDPNYAQLTFVNHPIDGAILNDSPAGGDPSIGWHSEKRVNIMFADGHSGKAQGGWWDKFPPVGGPSALPVNMVGKEYMAFPCHYSEFEPAAGANAEQTFCNYTCYNDSP